jgi:predicted O-methyltransferase YrrM
MTTPVVTRQEVVSDFSLSPDMIRSILKDARPFGHHEDAPNLNLGFGFIYYGVTRAIRPRHVLVIGSGYGFSVICLALALKDNNCGKLSFVDPSYSLLKHGPLKTIGGRGTWDDPNEVERLWTRFGVEYVVTHHRARSEEFFSSYEEKGLAKIDLAFIDGSHAFADVKHDFLNVVRHGKKNTYVFLHDTNIYFREFLHHAGVKRWIKVIQKARQAFEIVDFPFSSGVALVRVLEPAAWKQLA